MRYLLLGAALIAVASAAATISATVYIDDDQQSPVLVKGVIDKKKGAVYGYYTPSQNETGWDVLELAAGYATDPDPLYNAPNVIFCAGFFEGALTQEKIWFQYQNLYKKLLSDYTEEEIQKLKDFFTTQKMRMEGNIDPDSDFWDTVALVYVQYQGLIIGYRSVCPKSQQLDIFAFDLLNGIGDFLDISKYLFPHRRQDINNLTKLELESMLYRNGHCSALIKALPGYENIFASHSSWFVYSSMNRIYKTYAFKISNVSIPSRVMSFSSYPGFLESLDDFYMMDSASLLCLGPGKNEVLKDVGMTPCQKLEIHMYKKTLRGRSVSIQQSSATPSLHLCGKEWAIMLSSHNSGTYNNQYMVLDLKKIHLNESIEDDALWIVEQIPGYVASGDETAILRDGYWASYNIPFFERVYNASGYPEVVKRLGPDASYELCPRAKIFRRDEASVTDLKSMQHIMRYNDYTKDPYSEGNPMNAVCSRGDLLEKPEARGCYDTKVTDYSMALAMTAVAESGPTHQGLPPFSWTKSGLTDPHLGQPDLFNFGFVKMTPAVP